MSWYWLAWAVVSLLAFLGPELYVLVVKHRVDLTLSDTVRHIATVHRWFKWFVTGCLMVAASGAVLLGVHFFA